MTTTILAIDPGLQGGIVALYPSDPVTCEAWKMPVVKKEMDILAVKEILVMLKNYGPLPADRIFIERQQARPGFAGFNKLMDNYGALRGLIVGVGFVLVEVDTKEWQIDIFGGKLDNPTFKKFNAKAKKELKMDWGAAILKKQLPALEHNNHSGLIDAGLIALWGRGKG